MWYKGKTLIGALDEIKPIKRDFDGHLKIAVFDVLKVTGVGTVVRGKILSGHLEKDMKLYMTVGSKGNNIITECKSIEIHKRPVDEAFAGDIVSFATKGVTTVADIKHCRLAFNNHDDIIRTIKDADTLRVKILMINKKVTLRANSDLHLFCCTTSVPIRIVKIEYIINEVNQILEKDAEEIKNGGFAIIIIKIIKKYVPHRVEQEGKRYLYNYFYNRNNNPENVLYCEKYKDNPQLGSFALFNKDLFAVGFIKDINV